MNVTDEMVLAGSAQLGLFILSVSMALTVYRMVKGPHLADRIVALDLLSVMVVALAALYALLSEQESVLDVAIAYALVAFLGTVAFARYLGRQALLRQQKADFKSKGSEP